MPRSPVHGVQGRVWKLSSNVTIWYTVLSVGRHSLATARRKSPALLAAVIAPAAVFFAVGGDVHPLAAEHQAKTVIGNAARVVDPVPPCCLEIVAAAPIELASASAGDQSSVNSRSAEMVSASRWRA